jgi:hypothetical protein
MTGGVVSPNQILAPNGTLTGTKLVASSASSAKYLNQAITTVASTVYSWSAYLKAGEYTTAVIYFISVSSPFENCSATINLATGAITASSAGAGATLTGTSITPAGNGWYRCTLIGTIGAKTNMAVRVYPNTTSVFTGDDVSGMYIWGAQLEAGAQATSYIPTAASAVTRAADVAVIQGSNFYSWYNQNEGSVYSNVICSYIVTGANRSISIIGGTDQVTIGSDVTRIRDDNVDIGAFYTNTTIDGKRALAFTINQQAASRLGLSVSSSNAGAPSNLTAAYIGASSVGAYLNGTIKQISYYNTRLPNSTLASLTA